MQKSSILMVQVSPLIVKNDEGTKQISTPVAKMKLCSRSLTVIWDEDIDFLSDEIKHSIKSSESKFRKVYVRQGTACDGKDYVSIKEVVTKYHNDSNADNLTKITNEKKIILPFITLPSQDPSDIDEIPCLVRVFSSFNHKGSCCDKSDNASGDSVCLDRSLFHVLPHINVISFNRDQNLFHIKVAVPKNIPVINFNHHLSLQESLSGTCELINSAKEAQYDAKVIASFQTEIIRSLFLRMKKLLSESITVGTIHNAENFVSQHNQNKNRLRTVAKQYWGNKIKAIEPVRKVSLLRNIYGRDGALTVYDNVHSSGKTALVTAIARSMLKCQSVHIINASSLFCKFGANADMGLECLLHQIVISAAMKGCSIGTVGTICIILDELDKFVPSERKEDALLPALIANGSYFSELVDSLKIKRHFPTPKKNFLYGIKDSIGYILPVKVCIVGVITTDDNIVRKFGMGTAKSTTPLEALGQNRYRLPILSSGKNVTNENECIQPYKRFEHIGGNEDTKRALEEVLAVDKSKRILLEKFGLSLPTGILLFGPPGNGKTLLAKAVSQVMSASSTQEGEILKGGSFFSIKASNIVSSEIGTSEKLLIQIFESAQRRGPSVIFIDEFQALFTSRDHHNGGGKTGSTRLASTLLSLLDDVTKWRDANKHVVENTSAFVDKHRVVILAATNTPWMVDRAFIRAGRFDRVLHVGLPNFLERKSILQVHLQTMKLHPQTTIEAISSRIALETEGFSGAELSNLIHATAVRCILLGKTHAEMEHFVETKTQDFCRPTSNPKLLQQLKDWKP